MRTALICVNWANACRIAINCKLKKVGIVDKIGLNRALEEES